MNLNPSSDFDPDQTAAQSITFKRSHLYSLLLPLAFVAGLALGYVFWGRSETAAGQAVSADPAPQADPANQADGANAAEPANQAAAGEQEIKRYDVPEDDDPSIGPADAPITIIEFSDYQCPYCAQWHTEVFGKLLDAYPDQVRIVYRDFPLESIHPEATPASEAANCALEQGKFWEYHDLLFTNQGSLGDEAYVEFASTLGLKMDDFNACLEESRYADEVQADLNYAVGLGVRSTPTFFLNGIPLVGAQPYDVFSQVIEKELAGELD